MSTFPDIGFCKRLAIFNKVDLPDPEEPIIATLDDLDILKLRFLRTSILLEP